MRLAWAGWVLALLPFVFLVAWTCALWVDVPFWDQYAFVDVLRAHKTGELDFERLWAQHNEHRVLFPRLVMLGLARATDWNTLYDGLAGLALALLAFVVLALAMRARAIPSWGAIPVAVLMFSTSVWENWLWGWQLCIPLCLLGIVVAFLALACADRSAAWMAVAVLAGTVATYSFSTGLLVWPIGAALLAVQPATLRRRRPLLVWGLAGAFVVGSYLLGFEFGEATAMAGWARIERVLHSATVQLGGLLFPRSPRLAAGAGLAGVVLLALLFVAFARAEEERRRAVLPFLALGVFAPAAAIMIGLGRAAATPPGVTLRYLSFTGCLWIAVVVVPLLLLPPRRPRWAQVVLCLALVTAVLANVPSDLRAGREHSLRLSTGRDEVLRGDWDAASRKLHPHYSQLVDALVFLKQERLSLFRGYDQASEPLRPPADCALESRYDREARELVLRCPEFAGKTFRCLFSAAGEPPTRLPDGRTIPLAMDAIYIESMSPATALFAGHQSVFDPNGEARISIRLPGNHPGLRVLFSVHLVAEDAAFSIGRICRAGYFEL